MNRSSHVGVLEERGVAEPGRAALQAPLEVLFVFGGRLDPGDEVVAELVPGLVVVQVAGADAGDVGALLGQHVPHRQEVVDQAAPLTIADLDQVRPVRLGLGQLGDGRVDQLRPRLVGGRDHADPEHVGVGDEALARLHEGDGIFGGEVVVLPVGHERNRAAERVEVEGRG